MWRDLSTYTMVVFSSDVYQVVGFSFGSGRMLLKLTFGILLTGPNVGEKALYVVGAGSIRNCGCSSGDGSSGKTSSSSEGEESRSDGGALVSVGDGIWFDPGNNGSDDDETASGGDMVCSSKGDGTCSD